MWCKPDALRADPRHLRRLTLRHRCDCRVPIVGESVEQAVTEGPSAAPERRLSPWALLRVGSLAQILIFAAYTWTTMFGTVAASARSTLTVRLLAALPVMTLAPLTVLERRGNTRVRTAFVWMYAGSVVVTWLSIPESERPTFSAARGAALVVGWFLLSWSIAGPITPIASTKADRLDRVRSQRAPLLARVVPYFALATAFVLAVIGWDAASAERAVMIRLCGVTLSIILFGASATIAVQSLAQAERLHPRPRAQLGLVVASLVLLCLALIGMRLVR
jgi:hypothetical protein